MGAYLFLDFCMGTYLKDVYSRGACKIFFFEICVLVDCSFDATHTSNKIFFNGQANVR